MAIIKKTIFKENFLFPSFFKRLTHIIDNQFLDWRFEENTILGAKDNHMLFALSLFNKKAPEHNKAASTYRFIFEPILYFMSQEVTFKEVIRMKMNLYVNHTVQHVHKKHIDATKGNDGKTPLPGVVTAIFNFTECDGFTQVEDTKYPSKANSIIIFDGSKYHCGATPTNTKKRVVLNLNVV